MLRRISYALLAIVVLAAAAVGAATWWFDRSIQAEVGQLVANARDPQRLATSADLDDLPDPVRRYLTASGVVGKPIPKLVRLTQTGGLIGAQGADPMPFVAEQTYSTDPPAMVWRAWFPTHTLPVVMGRDAWLGDEASIVMKMFGLVSVADDDRPELRRAAMLRFLNEIMWFPQAYLLDAVSWDPIDDRSAGVTLTVAGQSVSGTVFFDDQDRQANFRAKRFNSDTGAEEVWETPMTAWGELDGVSVPTAGQAVWQLDAGPFAYIELEVTSIEYD